MNTLIIGSGFGLYGYLPAISIFSKNVYLNKNYKNKFIKRKNLKNYLKKIKWYSDQSKIIDLIDYIVVAKRPQDQFKIIKDLLNKKNNFKHLFLEKPMDINPNSSLNLINYLYKKKIKHSFGFIFQYLKWYKFIKSKIKKNQSFNITWHIKINKKNNKWKYDHTKGGGLIRFYGIHLIKLIFDLGFINIEKNTTSSNYWLSTLYDKDNNSINLELRFAKKDNFIFKFNKKKIFQSANPFLKVITKKKNDPRCIILRKYISSNISNYKYNFIKNCNFINFWKKIENI